LNAGELVPTNECVCVPTSTLTLERRDWTDANSAAQTGQSKMRWVEVNNFRALLQLVMRVSFAVKTNRCFNMHSLYIYVDVYINI